jgi:peptidyl-tRNA hydrolase, PTH1 family
LRLVAGLGNPGPQYVRTRHNLGFRIVEALARRHAVAGWRSRFDARVAQLPDQDAIVAMPQTFMNDSGAAIAPLAHYYRIAAENILIVCDDINLQFGQLRLRRRGSDGGHNGLKSIIDVLGTSEFPRLRAGIGRATPDAIGVVLGVFSGSEEAELPEIIDRAVGGIESFLNDGVDAAIAVVNASSGRGAADTEAQSEE